MAFLEGLEAVDDADQVQPHGLVHLDEPLAAVASASAISCSVRVSWSRCAGRHSTVVRKLSQVRQALRTG
jgi:hypothetical protein